MVISVSSTGSLFYRASSVLTMLPCLVYSLKQEGRKLLTLREVSKLEVAIHGVRGYLVWLNICMAFVAKVTMFVKCLAGSWHCC